MASLIYDSCLGDVFRGEIDFATDDFAVMLVGSGYVADKSDQRRSDVIDEVSGEGYLSGGALAPVSVATDAASNQVNVSLGGAAWPGSALTARGAVYYKARGGDPDDDNLVAFIDFLGEFSSASSTLVLAGSTLRVQN